MSNDDEIIETKWSNQQLLKDFLFIALGLPLGFLLFTVFLHSKGGQDKGNNIAWFLGVTLFSIVMAAVRVRFLSRCKLRLDQSGIRYSHTPKQERTALWSQVASYSVESLADARGHIKKGNA